MLQVLGVFKRFRLLKVTADKYGRHARHRAVIVVEIDGKEQVMVFSGCLFGEVVGKKVLISIKPAWDPELNGRMVASIFDAESFAPYHEVAFN
ncbi:MAG TPA: hypothetical protein VMX18_03470 [Candidatus Bipolaricaulota bacterium]|nr:hypothetical protein [Candidatus Bipolaricaulota bacterium]